MSISSCPNQVVYSCRITITSELAVHRTGTFVEFILLVCLNLSKFFFVLQSQLISKLFVTLKKKQISNHLYSLLSASLYCTLCLYTLCSLPLYIVLSASTHCALCLFTLYFLPLNIVLSASLCCTLCL
jgi:hypothetical protein